MSKFDSFIKKIKKELKSGESFAKGEYISMYGNNYKVMDSTNTYTLLIDERKLPVAYPTQRLRDMLKIIKKSKNMSLEVEVLKKGKLEKFVVNPNSGQRLNIHGESIEFISKSNKTLKSKIKDLIKTKTIKKSRKELYNITNRYIEEKQKVEDLRAALNGNLKKSNVEEVEITKTTLRGCEEKLETLYRDLQKGLK